MGWFDSAKNLIKSACNYFVSDDSDKKTDNAPKNETKTQKAPVSVVRPEGEYVGSVLDEVVITGSKKTDTKKNAETKKQNTAASQKKATTVTKKDIDSLIKSIEDKCKKLDITLEDAKKYINEEMEVGLNDIKNKNLDKQFRILSCVDAALTMQIMYKGKDGIAEDIDKAEFIGMVAQNYYDLIKNGDIKDIKLFQQNIDKAINNAYEGYKNAKTQDEKAKILDEARKQIADNVNAEYNKKQKGKSKAEKARLEKERKKALLAQERQAQLTFNAKAKPNERKDGIFLRSSEYYDEAHEYAKSCTDNKTRSEIAGTFSHDFENDALRIKLELGDEVSAEVYGRAIEANLQDMFAEDAAKFEADAYEFRQKVLNGEIDAPWMTKEHLKAESVAIGAGITNNRNMSSAEKAELLNTWDKHAREFADYCDVKEAYNKTINNYSETNENTANLVTNIKKILNENYNNDIERMPKAWEKRKQENPEQKAKASETELKSELKTKSVSEIKKNYSNTMPEIARIVLANDVEYKNRIDEILDYLKCLSGKNIGYLATGCSTPTISKIIQAFPEKANDILDVVAPSMCYAGRQTVEDIVEKGNDNEAV